MNWMGGSRRRLHHTADDRNALLKAGFERFRRQERLRGDAAASTGELEPQLAQGRHSRKGERSHEYGFDAHDGHDDRTVSKTSGAKGRSSRKRRSQSTPEVDEGVSDRVRKYRPNREKTPNHDMCRSIDRHIHKDLRQRRSKQSKEQGPGEESGHTDFVDMGLLAWAQTGQLRAQGALGHAPQNTMQDEAHVSPNSEASKHAPKKVETIWKDLASRHKPSDRRNTTKRRHGTESSDKCPSAQIRRLAIEEEWRRIADTGLCGTLGAARYANKKDNPEPSVCRQRRDPQDCTSSRMKGSERSSLTRPTNSNTDIRTPSPTQRVSLPRVRDLGGDNGIDVAAYSREESKDSTGDAYRSPEHAVRRSSADSNSITSVFIAQQLPDNKDMLSGKRIKLLTEAWAWGRQQARADRLSLPMDYNAERVRASHSASLEQATKGESGSAAATPPMTLAICDQAAGTNLNAVEAQTHGLARHDSATSQQAPSTQLDDDKSSDLLSTQPDVDAELNIATTLELAQGECASDHQVGPRAVPELLRDDEQKQHAQAERSASVREHEQADLAGTSSFSSTLRSWQASNAASTTGKLSLKERRKLCAAFLSR